MTTVQLRANHNRYGEVEPAIRPDEVQFFSVYLGNPGAFKWMADFECADEAISYTNALAISHNATIDRAQFDAVLTRPCKEHTMTTSHPHAHLMALYAQDAAETDKPWLRWEYRLNDFQPWVPLGHNPNWSPSCDYRRKSKTIKVNGFDVPEPLKEITDGATVWLAFCHHEEFADWYAYTPRSNWLHYCLKRGLIHATKEAAVAHAKAMLGIDPEGTV